MSKDMLGPLTRALVGVPIRKLGIFLDITNRIHSNDGEDFYHDLTKFVQNWKKYRLELILKIVSDLQSNESGSAFYEDLEKFVRQWEAPAVEEIAGEGKKLDVYLKLLRTSEIIEVRATDGAITAEQVDEVFNGYVSPDFVNFESRATSAVFATTYEVVEPGYYREIFGSLLVRDLNLIRWQRDQVVDFCRADRRRLWSQKCTSLFLMTRDGEPVVSDMSNVFVASVDFSADEQLEVYMYEFLSNLHQAEQGYCVVIPKQ